MTSGKTQQDALRVDDWTGEMGDRWLAHLDTFEDMILPVGEALLARAAFKPGERVIDIGCGGGATSRAIALQVAPGGVVLGVDISPQLLKEADRRARTAGVNNLRFVAADAAVVQPTDAPFDRLHSRFGSMFFKEPAAAFRNLGRLVRSGGRADFAVWAPAMENPWVAGLMGVLRRYIDMPRPEPRAPGPFSLDEPGYFGGLLRDAGFIDPDFHLWHGTQWIGGQRATAESALTFVLEAMSFGDVAKEQPADVQQKIRSELLDLFRTHATERGVGMDAVAWLVAARRA